MTSATGANQNLTSTVLNDIISDGLEVHLLTADQAYTDGGTALSSDSVASLNVSNANLTVNTPNTFSGAANITNDNDISFDVSGTTATTTVTHLGLQNQSNADEVILVDETNDPDIGTLDTYTINAGTDLYETGNPT